MSTQKIEKGNKKIMNGWAFYDWANSVYPLVITTAIFPIFYDTFNVHFTETINGEEIKYVYFYGFKLINTALISILTSIYFILIVLILPLLTGIADAAGNKKNFLRFFCYLGSFSCISLFFFDKNHLELSMISFALAGIGFWCSLVFYNAYLPEIAEEKDHDKLSAKGFSMGYVGSVLLLICCLLLVLNPDWFGIFKIKDGIIVPDFELAFRISFVATGIWWFGFSHLTFARLPKIAKRENPVGSNICKGFLEINKVWKQIKNTVRLKRYLQSFFVYSMAVQTIMIMAVYFGSKEIKWDDDAHAQLGLIVSVILIQLIAVPGAIGLSKLSEKIGNIKALILVVSIWIIICLCAFFVTTPIQFYFIAGFVGLVMGGIQSLSRSTYSKFIPENTCDTASFFSFYDISEKMGIVIGMMSYGLIEQITGSMRNSIVSLMLFFTVGLLLLLRVPNDEKNQNQISNENINS
jgi:UMF1 family MFS transporter